MYWYTFKNTFENINLLTGLVRRSIIVFITLFSLFRQHPETPLKNYFFCHFIALTCVIITIFPGEVERKRLVWPGVSHCWFKGDLVLWAQVYHKGHLCLAEARKTGECKANLYARQYQVIKCIMDDLTSDLKLKKTETSKGDQG